MKEVPPQERGEEKQIEEMSIDELRAEAERLESEIQRLEKVSLEKGENIDGELGGKEYVDFGFMAEAEELEEKLEAIMAELRTREEGDALSQAVDTAQKKLDL